MIKSIHKIPYKPVPFSQVKELIYYNSKNSVYSMVNAQTGRFIGNMSAFAVKGPDICGYNLTSSDYAFYINSLYINPEYRNQGWGGKLLKYAEKESPKHGCEGRVFLTAYNYHNSPHAFYYKHGYRCEDPRLNKTLAECVEYGIRPNKWKSVEMYLPLTKPQDESVNKTPKEGLLNKIVHFIKKYL